MGNNGWAPRWPGGYIMLSTDTMGSLAADENLSLDLRYLLALLSTCGTTTDGLLESRSSPTVIAAQVGCSRAGAELALAKLLATKYVTRPSRGVYRVSPDLAARTRWRAAEPALAPGEGA